MRVVQLFIILFVVGTLHAEDKALADIAKVVHLGDVMANVVGQGGRRYVKINIDLWVLNEEFDQASNDDFKKILIEGCERQLASHTFQELTNDGFRDSYRQQVQAVYQNNYPKVFGNESDGPKRVVFTNLLIQ